MLNIKMPRHALSLAMTLVGMSSTLSYAGGPSEIEELRREVQELRELVQRYAAQAQPVVQAAPLPAAPVAEKKGFLTKSGSEVSFYGMVRGDASYQIEGGPSSLPYNQIRNVALKGDPKNDDLLRTTLGATRFGFDFVTPAEGGNVTGKLEVDFLSGANYDNLRIRHAYLNYKNWLIGQTWSNFATPDYMPETVDALSYVGGSIKRTPQVRYNYNFDTANQLFVALEDSKDSTIKTRLPALTARFTHKFDNERGNLGARALVAEKRVDHDEATAWGVGVGTQVKLTENTTLRADYYHVDGDGSFVSSTNPGFAVNPQGKIDGKNEFDSIIIGLTQQFNPKLRGTLGYGYMTADKDNNYLANLNTPNALNETMWQAWANLFYTPVKPISFGVEYVYGERETFSVPTQSSRTGEDNRVNFTAIYNF